jgi:peptidyl-prolyl cis-trans isomerase A (cyclophilin A)
MISLRAPLAVSVVFLALVGCGDDSSGSGGSGGSGGDSTGAAGPGGSGPGASGPGGAGPGSGGSNCEPDVPAPNDEIPGSADPEAGDFTVDEALAELPEGPGPLRAIITTEKGVITCELFPDDAPIGVANFAGLARGRRPGRDAGTWVRRRYYDGLAFHRIIDDFVAQGGDPLGTGTGGPGYQFVNEISAKLHVPGTLAYANAGADTNGSQFYITEVALPNLDGDYTVFGGCAPMDVIQALTSVPTDANDKPLEPVHTQTVEITRCAP